MPESKIRRGKALLAAALALVVFPVLSPLAMAETSLAQGPLTLDRSLELALAANPDIEVASRELAASEGTLVQGYAPAQPSRFLPPGGYSRCHPNVDRTNRAADRTRWPT